MNFLPQDFDYIVGFLLFPALLLAVVGLLIYARLEDTSKELKGEAGIGCGILISGCLLMLFVLGLWVVSHVRII